MTRVEFTADEKGLCGFHISGHSSKDCDDEAGRLVCAAVSSAAYLAANTITEIIGDRCKTGVSDADMSVRVCNASDSSRIVLEGLLLHMRQLSEQYTNHIRIITEV